MINIPFVSLYQLLSSGTLTNNPVTLGIISIAPSPVLSSPLLWILKNKVVPAFIEGETESEGEAKSELEVGDREGDSGGKGGGRNGTHIPPHRNVALKNGLEGERQQREKENSELHVVVEAGDIVLNSTADI